MKNIGWWQLCLRLYLWLQAIGVMIFYLFMWRRISRSQQDRISPQAPQASELASNDQTKDPLVSIIVPARNEERNIRRCVESLLEQDYEPFEVIAINDDSTDATGNILEDIAAHHPRGHLLHVLHLHELPEGWTGKTHAVHCGTEQARGEWLLLTDADTWHSSPALRVCLAQAIEEGVDMFSFEPVQELVDFWNKVLMPYARLGIYMNNPPHLVNDPKSPVAAANGQFILLRRSVYDAIGGFARSDLHDAQAEDRALATAVKSSGFRLHFVVDSDLVHTYMYSGFSEIWRGVSRHAYRGKRNLAVFLFSLFGTPHISFIPCLVPLLLWLGRRRRRATKQTIHPVEAGLALGLQWTSILAFHCWLNRVMRVPALWALTQPLAGSIMTGILAHSMWRGFTGKASWRGRQYSEPKKQEMENKKESSVHV